MNMNPSSPSCCRSRYLSAAVSAALSLAATTAAQAGPQNGSVTRGAATISTPDAGLTQIDQSSHSVSIDWQSFNVAANERVVFNQPSTSAVALNRILTQDPSQIHGSILANGRVFLLNPNGIIFGATARINVGSLVASSLDITDMDEAAQRYSFGAAAASSGAIVNDGRITAADGGSVTLLGGSVVNHGWIVADYGTVNLGAGRAATLSFDADGLVRFQIDAGLVGTPAGVDAAVNNTGEIVADGGQVLLTARQAGDVIARAVNNDGVIRAARIDNSGGRIRLVGPEGEVASSGTLDASAGDAASVGGEVQVLGERVTLSRTALVDVSGGAGGGTALIGGSFNGADPAVINAQQTDVQQGAVIRADATVSGDAGRVAVWSDGATTFNGDILARAQGISGNGGYAEVSGRQHLLIDGHAQLGSAQGAAGTLLLDPGSVDIVNGNNTAPAGALDTIRDGWIIAQLAGSNLIISTNTSTNNLTEDLVVAGNANITWNSANSLTLIGDDSLTLAAGSVISNAGSGALTLQSGGAVALGGDVTLGGNLSVTAGANITQSAALTVGGAASFTTGSGQSILLGNAGNSFGGTVAFNAASGNLQNVTISDATALDLQVLAIDGNLTVTSGGGLTQSGALDVAGNASFTAAAGQSIVLGNAGNTFTGTVTLASGGPGNLQDVTLRDSTALGLQALAVDGDLAATSGGALTQSGALSVGGNTSFTAAAGQSIVLGNAGNAFTGSVTLASGGPGNLQNATISDSTALDLQALSVAGNLTVTSGGALTQSGALGVGGNASFTAAAGQSIVLGNAGNTFTGTVTLASGGPGNLQNVTISDSTALGLQALSLNGNLGVTSGGALTQSGALVVGGNASFTAAAGQSITLGDAGNSFAGTVTLASSGPGNLQNVTLRDSTALDLQALTLNGNLTARSGAALTQSGALNVGGNASFTAAAGQSLSFANAGNVFGGTVSFASGGPGNLQNVTVNDSTSLDLQALTLAGNLIATSGGAIAQSGALVVGGNASFTAAAGQSVILGNASNAFTGTVTFASAGPGNLQNVTVVDSTALDLQALTLAGNLTATSGAALTQSGALVIGGNSTFGAGAGQSISLGNSGNTFTGTVALAASGPGNLANVTLRGTTALNLQALTIGGDLSIVAGGPITQSGALSVAGDASFRTLNDTGAAITLSGTNSFGSVQAAVRNGADTVNAAANIAISESNSTLLGDIQTAAGQSVSITSAGAIAAQANTDITTGSLTLAATGDIGSSNTPISLIAANGSLDATSTGNIYVENSGGVVLNRAVAGNTGSINVSSNGDIRVADVRAGNSVSLIAGGSILDDAVDGAGSQVVTGVLALQAAGAIGEATGTGNGMLELRTSAVTANATGGGVYLDAVDGDLGIRRIDAAGPVSVRAAAGSIVDDTSDAAAAAVVSTAGGIQLRALNNIGTVTDVATRQGSAIGIDTGGGALSAQVSSATGQINLDIAGGSNPTAAAGAVAAGGAGRLLLQSSGDLALDAFAAAFSGFAEVGFSADGTLTLTSGLMATPLTTLLLRGAVDVVQTNRTFDLSAGRLSFESGGLGGGVTLNTNTSRFDGAIGNGADLNIVNAGDLTLGSIAGGGNVSVRAANILDDGDVNTVTRVTAGGRISLEASGGIGQADGVGTGRIDTAGSSVSLLAQTGSAYLSHQGNLQVGGEAGGSIDIVTPSGSITVGPTLRANALALTAGSDAVGAAVAGNIVLSGTAQANGTAVLTARGGGAITDADNTSTHLVAGDTRLQATRIGASGNALSTDLTSLDATAPDGLYLQDANDLQLRSLSAQTISIVAGGRITDDGNAQTRLTAADVALSGTSIGAAGAGNEIDTAVDRLSATATNGGIYIGEAGDIALGAVSAAGAGNDIAVVASGAITDDGDNATRIAGGNLSLQATSIGAANGPLQTQATSLTAAASSGGVFVNEVDDLQVNSVTATGNVALSAGGALSDDGNAATRVAGDSVTLAATRIGSDAARIGMAAASLTATASNGGIYVAEQDSITLVSVRSSGAGNTVDLQTGNNGNIAVQELVTQGGAVNLAAGGTGSLTVTGAIESNDGVVNLTSGDALALPGLDSGTGSIVLHTVNDLNVGSVVGGSISITSDTGDISLGAVNAGSGVVSITAANGVIRDDVGTSLIAGQATLLAQSIGSDGNALNVNVGTLTANATAGGLFIDDIGGLTVADIRAAGPVSLATTGALVQTGAIASGGQSLSVIADSIDMGFGATTLSGGGDIFYLANRASANLAVLDAASGRVLVMAADSVYSSLGGNVATNNLSGAMVEVRAGGLGGAGEIGTLSSPLSIATPGSSRQSVYLIVPAVNGIQTSTPSINYAGGASAVLLKGYSGSSGTLFFDRSSAFTPDTVLLGGESIVPLRNGRVAVNTDSLSAAKQALSSGVVIRINVDWAAFDPDVSLFGTLDPALRLPQDQVEEPVPEAGSAAAGTGR